MRCTAARSSTSPSTSGPSRSTYCRWVGVRALRGQPARALRPGGLRPRVPDAGRTTPRSSTRSRRAHVPEAARGVRVGRPRVRHRVAGGGRRHQRPRPLVPRLRADGGDLTSMPPTVGGRADARARRPSCSRSAGASPATACGRRCARSPSGSRSRCTRCRAAPQVLDWTVPDEWNIRDAYIATRDGERVVDFRASNLHVVSYSEPVRAPMSLDGAAAAPAHASPSSRTGSPTARRTTRGLGLLPRASAARRARGRRVRGRHRQHARAGLLTYGECVLPGERDDEVLLTPTSATRRSPTTTSPASRCSPNSASALAARPRRFTYGFLFIPGTIGSITWLARNEAQLDANRGGLVLACVGDARRSRTSGAGAATRRRPRRCARGRAIRAAGA